MTINDIHNAIEEWFPAGAAWKGDNIGLQIGRPHQKVTNILVALDVTLDVVAEARRKKANVIVTHHPLIFRPIRSITPHSRTGEILLALAEAGIALYAAHTNMDSARGGVNDALGSALGLENMRILSPLDDRMKKIVVFVPRTHLERVAAAMHAAGGGGFSNYTECSFRTDGIGTFKGRENAQPFLGSVGILERAEETKLEMLVPAWKVTSVVRAMRGVHPYEEVAYDVVPLENSTPDFGLGIIGTLPNAMTGKQFLSFVKKSLGATMLRVVGDLTAHVKTVAACGGSGAEFIEEAARKGADAYVTGDLKYHAMQDVPPRLLLIDAGHYETERHVLPHLHKKLQHLAKATKSSTHVFVTTQKTNTIAII